MRGECVSRKGPKVQQPTLQDEIAAKIVMGTGGQDQDSDGSLVGGTTPWLDCLDVQCKSLVLYLTLFSLQDSKRKSDLGVPLDLFLPHVAALNKNLFHFPLSTWLFY